MVKKVVLFLVFGSTRAFLSLGVGSSWAGVHLVKPAHTLTLKTPSPRRRDPGTWTYGHYRS